MRRVFQLLMTGCVIALLTGCGKSQTARILDKIDSLANYNADSAQLLLNSLLPEKSKWDKADRMRYDLSLLHAQNKAGCDMRSDSMAEAVAAYFNKHGSENQRVRAYYLLGRTYADMGESPRAIQAFYDAIEQADTSLTNYNFETLIPIYGQMAIIFHQQNLPYDEIWALQHYIRYIQNTGDSLEYAIAKEQLIRPYYLLGEKDTVLQIIDDTYQHLIRLGYRQEAADALVPAIYIKIERRQYAEAKKLMDIFERESCLFDGNGNIAKSREHYYATKGFYELAINSLDSAESYFRRAILYGHLSDGYRGLLSVYRAKSNMDSVVHFSQLYESAQDSLHNQMQTDAIRKMAALYNYNRVQKMADMEALNAQKAWMLTGLILLTAILLLCVAVWLYGRSQKEKRKLEHNLESAKKKRKQVQDELQMLLDRNYEKLLAEKERKNQDLTKIIESLEKLGVKSQISDNIEDFQNSKIVQVFTKKAKSKSERPIPNDAEWEVLAKEFGRLMPNLYSTFGKKLLSPLEQHTCILIILGYTEATIVKMTKSSSPAVSTAKRRANTKLFGKDEAQSLKYNLNQAIKGFD